ncbi:trichothecene efflux pump [Mytilinidion resinicola]|uniref:Trichothecene efflux pump n=1 Tax=Mytilinidion resinicola TaxID=574789 RepID=A0A6A6Z9T2_9PEZI|nr:trichothecene efflux pump [Mytilinidion resinicola]KAF2817035.1 trichothecene efflux pump [Mytilinidion resinicola]
MEEKPSSLEPSHTEKTTDETSNESIRSDDDFNFTFGKFLAILSFQLGYFADLLVLTGTSAVLSVINRDIGPSASYSWIATSQIVGAAALAPVCGRFGDIFGRRNILFVGNVFGIIGAIVAATSKDVNTMIAGGTFLGMANAMHQVAWACLGEVVPKRSRGFAFGFFESSIACGTVIGPLIGWGFVQNGSWRPLFWLTFALNATALILVFFFYHPINQYIHEEGKTTIDQLKETDFIGTFLYIAGIVLFLWGISVGGSLYAWKSAGALAPLLIGFFLVVAMGFYEAYGRIHWPIFPPIIFRNVRGVTVILAGVFIYGILFYGTAVIWPQQVVALYAKSNMQNGWYSTASGFGGLCTSPIYGWSMRKFGHVRWQLTFIIAALSLLSGCQATVTPESHVASTALVFLVYSFVAGTSILTAAMVQLNVEHEFIGVATGVMICVRTVGGAVGSTIYVSILQNKLTDNIPKDVGMPLALGGVPPANIPAVIEALTSGNVASPALSTVKPQTLMLAVAGLKQAFASSFKIVYLTTIAFGAVGVVIVAFASDVDHLMTRKIEIRLEEGAIIHGHTDTGAGHIIRHQEKKLEEA